MKSIRIFLALTLLAITGGVIFAQEEEVDYDARLVTVLDGYQGLFDPDDIPPIWYIVARAIEQGYLRFTIDPDSRGGVLSGAKFVAPPGKQVAHIVVLKGLLDIWPSYPSTVYAVLTGAFHECATFFQDPPAWGAARFDRMEQLFLKVGGYTAQAELIQKYLLPEGYFLSEYDTYMLDSYEQDGLGSVVLFVERFSLPVAKSLYQLRLAYEKNNDDKTLREFIVKLGEKLLSERTQIPDDSDDETVYAMSIAVHSWLVLTPEIIARLYNKNRKNNPLSFEQILVRENEYRQLRLKLESSFKKDLPIVEKVNRDIMKRLGEV